MEKAAELAAAHVRVPAQRLQEQLAEGGKLPAGAPWLTEARTTAETEEPG